MDQYMFWLGVDGEPPLWEVAHVAQLPYPARTKIMVAAMMGHDLYWSREKPAYAEVDNSRPGYIQLIWAPPANYRAQGWDPLSSFPVDEGTLVYRQATEDEIARYDAMAALSSNPLPDIGDEH